MQIVSTGDNLHEMSNPVFRESRKNKKITNLSSADFADSMVRAENRDEMQSDIGEARYQIITLSQAIKTIG